MIKQSNRKFHKVALLLARFGFSYVKAYEIKLDAARGDIYARSFVGLAFKQRHKINA